jgi:predicted ATPase
VPERPGVLVGRRAELDVLQRALTDLETGTGCVVQLAGEPGIGKTRLVVELCGEVERRHHLVLGGRAAAFEEGQVFAVLVDALDDYLASIDPRDLERMKLDFAELAWVFPALARLAERPLGALPAERYRTHLAVRGLLEALGGRRPLVLALDDVHWADAASVELITFLLRRPAKGRVLTVLAFRPAQVPQQFEAALAASTGTPGILRLDLDGLTEQEAGQLIGAGVGGATAHDMYVLSGGNPFYLEQLARAGHLAGAGAPLRMTSADPGPVPVAVLGAITDVRR